MPPKKQRRPATAEAPHPQPRPGREPVTDNDDDNGDGDGDNDKNASSPTGRDRNSGPGSDPETSQRGAEAAAFKFFNTTFSTFRVSPLYTGQNVITPAGLEMLSRRLRDTLVGDVVRGVQVGLESDATLGRLGVLGRVEWRECSLGSILPTLTDAAMEIQDEARQRRHAIQARRRRGQGGGAQAERVRHLLCLELEYEKATFSALMLPSLDGGNEEQNEGGAGDGNQDAHASESSRPRSPPSWAQNDGNPKSRYQDREKYPQDKDEDKSSAFARYPLLLTRMPAPLKSVLIDFLSNTFDCRISPLYLGTRTLIRSWERWIEESGVDAGKALSKDVALTLGFHLEPSVTSLTPGEQQQITRGPKRTAVLGLKTIDIVVPSEEVRRFLRVGKKSITGSADADKGKSKLWSRKRPADTVDQQKERRKRRRLGGGKDEEGWAWRQSPRQRGPDQGDHTSSNEIETFTQPFTNALSHYLERHLALDVTHPGVRVLRVVCDAFALSETRMKVFAPRRGGGDSADAASIAIDTFLRNLILRAQGRELGGSAMRLANLRVIA
ncbi:kinetochore complex Sim4 subunit Fta1-domain-containing protein [Xylaria sp. FL1777]|nr:kinetochore complex Sim4 subunit Fta1-domain-containing protein [Xylaria sp. FL1777]